MTGDLISRSALIAEYDRVHVGAPGGARKLMEEAPAVDAVEVVRCKDCIYYETMCKDVGALPEDFCCDAERKPTADESEEDFCEECPAEDIGEEVCEACMITYTNQNEAGAENG